MERKKFVPLELSAGGFYIDIFIGSLYNNGTSGRQKEATDGKMSKPAPPSAIPTRNIHCETARDQLYPALGINHTDLGAHETALYPRPPSNTSRGPVDVFFLRASTPLCDRDQPRHSLKTRARRDLD
ncbi:hypothetical protein WN51_10800 [Melipona quadrifasciata]|uniref:Uncharacterized protein n=1 Tax=Melipona quadrifasciata TaxID=166423 RepID=A0A0N1ITT6_9HYME|nr:hypothetical protein WN51_10800 [Melipona quadrifasciata]